jgi:hypothetical protein
MNRKKRKLEVLQIAPEVPPKPPTKEEIKAIKKRDHQLLNLLKVNLQPIMDQIKKKYRSFRAPVIPPIQIQYLFEETDESRVSADIQELQFRPYEKAQNKEGVWGLRDSSNGNFFYNLEIVTIEERLSNGYYARPKDFLADVRSLAKDAKHIGDKEKTLKANELLSNVEVDIAGVEANPAFADCENVYQRQLQRVREQADKQKAKQRAQIEAGESVAEGSGLNSTPGPVTLGVTIPGTRPFTGGTPPRPSSGLSNGISANGEITHASNGTSVPSRGSGDVQMGGTDDHFQGIQPPNQQWPRMPHGPSNLSGYATGAGTQLSQRSGFQEIPHDTSPTALINDASTTTSGKKTSEGWSTQATNGIAHPESSSPIEKLAGDSQLPDTQGHGSQLTQPTQGDGSGSSEESWLHSQAHGLAKGHLSYPSQTPSSGNSYSQNPAVPPFNAPTPAPRLTSSTRPASMANILNDSPVEPTSSQLSSQRDLIEPDSLFIDDLLRTLTEQSSGCSVEQLEQINRELMEKLWEMRGEWNRSMVAMKLIEVFNETIGDIEEMQKIMASSQPSQMS